MVEHLTCNQRVVGSTPAFGSNSNYLNMAKKLDLYGTTLKVVNKLQECRQILDLEMYGSGPDVDLNSFEFKKLREIYNAICKVIDLT